MIKAIKERRMEVQANTHLFRLRFNDERTKKVTISTELAMRITKIDKLKHRYETIAMNSNGNTARNQAQHIIEVMNCRLVGDSNEYLVCTDQRRTLPTR